MTACISWVFCCVRLDMCFAFGRVGFDACQLLMDFDLLRQSFVFVRCSSRRRDAEFGHCEINEWVRWILAGGSRVGLSFAI